MKYLIFLLSFNVYGASYSFVPPAQRAGNTALLPSEIAGYTVYVDRVPTKNLPGVATSFELNVSGEITMRTIDTDGRYSDFSNPVIAVANPKPPVLQ